MYPAFASRLRLTFALVSLGLLAACTPGGADSLGDFAIVAPLEGARVGTSAVRVQGHVGNDAIHSVLVNGETVAVSDGEFHTTLLLDDGPARIEASAGELVDVVNVYVDSRAPTVVIDAPIAGSFIEGDRFELRGHLEDATNATVTVDGESVELDASGAFTWGRDVRPGAHRVRVRAEDDLGHVGSAFTSAIIGHFADPEAPLTRAISLALGPDALRAITTVAAPHMSPEAVAPFIMAANPVAEGFWGEVNASGESHNPVYLRITPGNGALDVGIDVPNIAVPFVASLAGFDISGTAYVGMAYITATAWVDAADGRPVVDIGRSEVALQDVLIDVDGLWDWVDQHVVTAALRGTIESSLQDAVANEIPTAIESALATLPMSQEIELQGYRAEVLGAVAELRSTEEGLKAVLDAGVRPVGGPGAAMRDAPGAFFLGSGLEPDSALPGVEGAVTLDLINAALHAAWGVGALAHRLDEVPGPGGTPLNVGLVNVVLPVSGAPQDALVSVEVEAALPPVVQPTDTGLEMNAADLHVRLFAPVDGEDTLLANVSCGVRATVTPILAADGLGLTFDEVEVTIDGIGELDGLPPPEDLDHLLGELLAPLLASHGELRGLSIPTVAGFDIGADALFVHEGYVVFQGELDAH